MKTLVLTDTQYDMLQSLLNKVCTYDSVAADLSMSAQASLNHPDECTDEQIDQQIEMINDFYTAFASPVEGVE